MSHPERGFRGIRSIPPLTSLDVSRGRVTLRIGGGSLSGGVGRVSRKPADGETDWRQTVAKHVFQKPPRLEQARPKPYERDGKIECRVEVIEDYDGKGELGIILQFPGIGLTKTPFLRSRYNRPGSPVFYIPVNHDNKMVNLFLATRGDIFESQIVPKQMNVKPFFLQQELYLPQLTKTHDPASMTAYRNNNLVIVGYKPLPTR